MKHRNYSQVYPYTYYIKRLSDGLQYHGVRFGNVKCNKTPMDDFGIYYFTSGKFKSEFKLNPRNFKWKIKWTFDSCEEALLHETHVNERLKYKLSWINSYGKFFPVESSKLGREKSFMIKYGVSHNSKIPSVVEKRKISFIKKYGVDNPTKSDVVLNSIKKTNLRKYGVEWSYQSTELKERMKNTWMKKYGVDNPLKSSIIQKRVKSTNFKRYGVEYVFQSKDVINKIHKKRKDMYIRLARMTSEEFSVYLLGISQCKAVQSQKKSQRLKGIEILANNPQLV